MKKTSIKKLTLLIVVIILIIAGGAYFVFDSDSSAPNYATESVQRGNIESSVLANGMLQASKFVSVGAQASGQIINLPVALGQQVKQGELIAQIDSLTQQNKLKEAIASLTSNEAQYRAKQAQINLAQQEFNRQKSMLADNASSKADYESAQATLLVYLAELDQLKAQQEQVKLSVESAQLNLGYTTIKAPMDGMVVYTAVTVGQTVNSTQSTPTIVELADLTKMTVKAKISEADVIKVKPGQAVYFTILGQPQKRFNATLRAIEPGPTIMDGDDSNMTSSDTDAIYYNGLFDVENPDGILRIGMTAQVSIILEQGEDVILVPSQILQPNHGKRPGFRVPVLVNDEIEYRNVTVGINNKVNAEITEGLEEGDQIILGTGGSTDTVSARRGNRRSPMGF
ncbi:efflux RND transporter periplasmic adaptor subunit [Shewanella sp. MF05960]|uniref:efflux RND transporter periplasmic adaptor subunit n=1 Tax=Shewanella sp. MF05960 TaxID=3434874 RepID=UPI003D78D5D0